MRLKDHDVRVTAQTAYGYGSFLASTSEPDCKTRAATMKIRAAACWCLVSPARAPAVFSEASQLYEELGHPFAITVAICAGEQKLPLVESRQSTAPEDQAYRALWLAWSVASGKKAATATPATPPHDRDWFPAGQLEIPVRLYLDFSRDVRLAIRHTDPRRLVRSLPQLLQRGTEPVKMAMTDQYHWQRLMTGVMPVEPELLAIGRIAHRTLGSWDESTLTNLGIPPNSIERMPLWIARMLEKPPDSVGPPSGPGGRPRPSVPTDQDAAMGVDPGSTARRRPSAS